MCVVCAHWETEKLTRGEALKALWELVEEEGVDELHLKKVYAEIEKAPKGVDDDI